MNRQRAGQQASRKDEEPAGDEEPAESCPDDGYYPDADQCDKYYECRDGKMIEKICEDGKVFNDASNLYDKCDLPFNIDCSQRPKLRP